MKKIFLTLGTIGMVVSPSLTLISCGDEKSNANNNNNNAIQDDNAIKEKSILFSSDFAPEAIYQFVKDFAKNILLEAYQKEISYFYSNQFLSQSAWDTHRWDNLQMLSLSSKGELVFEVEFTGDDIVQANHNDNIIIKKGQKARFEVSNVDATPSMIHDAQVNNIKWKSTKFFLDDKLITKSFALNNYAIQNIIQMYKQSKWINTLVKHNWTKRDAWLLVWGFMSNKINAIGKSTENANNILNDNEISDFVNEISQLKLLAHGNLKYDGINGRDVFLFSGSTNGKKYLGANGSTSVTNSFLSKDLFKSQLHLTDAQINTISYVIVPVSSDLYSFGGKFNPTNGSISPNIVLRNHFFTHGYEWSQPSWSNLPNLDQYPTTPPHNYGYTPTTSSSRKK